MQAEERPVGAGGGRAAATTAAATEAVLRCARCGVTINVSRELRQRGYIDLTPQRFRSELQSARAGASRVERPQRRSSRLSPLPSGPLRQELFRNPLMAYLYERGWRNQFLQSGFPGVEAEYNIMEQFFDPERRGGAGRSRQPQRVMDLSCGTGMVTRRLASSGKYDKVVAVDYSEAMLQETIRRASPQLPDAAVRANAERLPFTPDQFSFINVGAAIHCWPRMQDGLRQVRRVLRESDGGRFFATTFLLPGSGITSRSATISAIAAPLRSMETFNGMYRFFERPELERLLRVAGFDDVDIEVMFRCAIIRCSAHRQQQQQQQRK